MTKKRIFLMLAVAATMVLAGCAQNRAPARNSDTGMESYSPKTNKRFGGFANPRGR